MSDDASPSEKAVYDYYKQVIRNIQNNEQGGLIIPQAYDPESRQPLFEFSLMSVEGSKMYDTDALVRRWDAKILTALLADILRMGQDSVGSYALASEKSSIMHLAIETRLREIQDVINNDLIRQLFDLNGYASDEELPVLKYVDFDSISLDEFSKAIQRMFSVGAVEFDRPIANRIRDALGVDQKPANTPVDRESLSNSTSRAGDGMTTAGAGTSDSVMGDDDTSISNMENA